MEYLHSNWLIGIIALIAGVLIGALAYRLLSPSLKQATKVETELNAARDELNSYKASVNQHFNKTSELVNDLTQNYVKVYQHLAEGAQILGDSKTFTSLLEQHQGRVSIAVDDETNSLNKVADDLLVVPAVTQAASVETVDEHARPFTDVNAEETKPVSSQDDTAKTRASVSSGNPDDPTAAMEPVLNVDAPEEVIENSDTEVRVDAGSAVPEDEGKSEVRATTQQKRDATL